MNGNGDNRNNRSRRSAAPADPARRRGEAQGNRARSTSGAKGMPPKRPAPPKEENELIASVRELLDKEKLSRLRETLAIRMRLFFSDLMTKIFLSKERIISGVVIFFVMLILALLQTTLFSRIRPFGSVPDLMLSFTIALSVTEGRRCGAVWGIASALFIEALNVPSIYILPILYMFAGYFGGVICRHYLTESFAVRAILSVGAVPFKAVFTAVYAALSPLSVTAGEIFFDIVLPEAGATLLLAAPVHVAVYFATRPFHRTRSDMVSERQ